MTQKYEELRKRKRERERGERDGGRKWRVKRGEGGKRERNGRRKGEEKTRDRRREARTLHKANGARSQAFVPPPSVIAELANDIAWDAVGAQIEPYLRQHA